jgi:hypothetical protein
MQPISRRKFLGTSAMGIMAVSSLPLDSLKPMSTPFKWPLSFQSWGVRKLLANDFDNTLLKIRALGYKGIEMCSPRGYEQLGFGPLTKFPVSELRKKIEDAAAVHDAQEFLRGRKQVKVIKKSAIKEIVDSLIAEYGGLEHSELLAKMAEYELRLADAPRLAELEELLEKSRPEEHQRVP